MKNPIKSALKSFLQNSFSEQELNVMAMAKSNEPVSKQIDNRQIPISRVDIDSYIHAVNATRSQEPTRVLLTKVFDRMDLDDLITHGVQKRMSRILRSRFDIKSEATGESNDEAAKLLKKQWFQRFIEMSLMSQFRGPQLIEITELENKEIKKLTVIPENNWNPWKQIIQKNQGDLSGWEYTEPPLSTYYVEVGDTDKMGLWMKLASCFIYKSFVMACYADYCHKYGTPPRILKRKGADKKRLLELEDIMKNMLGSNWAIIDEQETLDIFEPKNATGSKDIFLGLINKVEAAIIRLLIGENGTTDGSASGTYGSVKAMAEVSDDIHEMDKQMLHFLINDELLPRLIQLGYPLQGHYFEWDDFQDLDAKEVIQAVKDLSQAYEFDHEKLAKRTRLPITGIRRMPGEVTASTGNADGLGKFKARMQALYGEPTHTGVRITANYGGDVDRIIRDTFNGRIDANQLDAALSTAIGGDLNRGATAAFDFNDISYDAPDNILASKLRDNLYAFSAAKSYAQMKQMSELLVDENGKVRSFADFKREAEKVAEIHNVTWLETERNNAIASGQMAAQWNRYQENKDLLPLLEYSTAGDARVRDSHSRLDGVVKPVDDPWWDNHYPPLDHGCRCDVIATGDTTRATLDNPTIDVDPAFQSNVGKSGVVYTNAHPYYQVLPQAPTALDAVRNYGMRKASKILADPKGLSRAKSREVQRSDGFEVAIDHDALAVRIDNAVLSDSDKSHLAKSVVKSASEVWTNERTTRYLKYYENGAAIIDVDSSMTAVGFRWFDLDEASLIDTVRNGILLKR